MYNALRKGRIKRNGRERKPERKHIATVNVAFFPIYVLENKRINL